MADRWRRVPEYAALVPLGALVGVLASGCGSSVPPVDRDKPLADGTYSGLSGEDEDGATGQVTLTVRDGAVAEVDFEVVNRDGTPKDENYGKDSTGAIANSEYYAKAQAAVEAFDVYAAQLIEVGYPDEVDVISGATWAYDQFVEASTEALLTAQGVDGATEHDEPGLSDIGDLGDIGMDGE
ncbi:MAG: FMN-binding protein [Bifidobacteriaceae bacterium]|jgi:major membrane immunogen (membrane-anchored lipoprotein)|nr:FMN-binding protein [Bifidobacteriaceae bacterium]